MAPKFGTSGLRGLVSELTESLVADHIRAFVHACPVGTGLYVGRDLRPSSPALVRIVIETALAEGVDVTDCGAVPTPALALAAMGAGAAAIMVTGSHIPADRNGLKFYVPTGEITKVDEVSILGALGRDGGQGAGSLALNTKAGAEWVARYVTAFGAQALLGQRIGLWSHSAVSRDLLRDAITALGAEAVEVGRSDTFIPVDTEAVPDWARKAIADWVLKHHLDALVSTDGDGDRPLLADEKGRVIPGDILGQITARAVGAEAVVTPVTSNSGVEASGNFARVFRTKVGSPFVIARMEGAGARVVGYEGNGGFLLGFDAVAARPLLRLMTRDSLLPLIATLAASRVSGSVSLRVTEEPPRFTASDRVEDIPTECSTSFVLNLQQSVAARSKFLRLIGETAVSVDLTDGLRIVCVSGNSVHLRPSGNAPEMRVYAESETETGAKHLLERALGLVSNLITSTIPVTSG